MDKKEIAEKVNKGLSVFGNSQFVPKDTESDHRTEVRGTLNGRSVRVEVSVDDEPSECQWNVWLYDEETGVSLGRGNGGRSLEEAVSIYQWNNALSDLEALGKS